MEWDSVIVYFPARLVFTCGYMPVYQGLMFISSRASREDVEVSVRRVSLGCCLTPRFLLLICVQVH